MTSHDRRLTAIVFTDIVGYSAIVHRDEALGEWLLNRQRVVVRKFLRQYGGREVDTIGDGFLIEFGSALSAVQAVISIQQELARLNAKEPESTRVLLRASVHLGDVEHRSDDILGDGVNTAARLLPFSPEGGLALSAPLLGLIRQRIQLPVRSIGAPELKNISTPVEIFLLDADVLQALEAPAPDAKPNRSHAWRRFAAVTASSFIAVAIVIAGTVWGLKYHRSATASGKSIAVLPFTNLSEDKTNGYFTDGIHDALITNLAHVHDLKVISRTSVMEFRGTTRNLRKIAEQLGVANIVEASVQRAGSHVRVNVQLIEAASDRHIWAEIYDREISDVFALQSDLAQKIASNVQVRLTDEERRQLDQRPTASVEAYELYLRGREIETRNDFSREVYDQALAFYERAIAVDPGFAEALAAASSAHAALYWFDFDHTSGRLARSRELVEAAQKIAPDSADVQLALGYYRYWGFRDYTGAQVHFRRAEAVRPGSAEAIYSQAMLERRQSQWEASVAHTDQAIELDPLDLSKHRALVDTLFLMRRYHESERALARLQDIGPGFRTAMVGLPVLRAAMWGDTAGLAQLLPTLDLRADRSGDTIYIYYGSQLWLRQYAAAAKAIEDCPLAWINVLSYAHGTNARHPRELLLADAYRLLGRKVDAHTHYLKARRIVEAEIAANDEDARLHASLSQVLAGLGEDGPARKEAERAVDLMSESRDAIVGTLILQNLAAIYAETDETAKAIGLLRELLTKPSNTTVALLRMDPRWDPLRKDPRFQALLKS